MVDQQIRGVASWVRLDAKGQLGSAPASQKALGVTPEQMEIARLRAENARLKMERDIAKKAAAYFAQEVLQVKGEYGWPRMHKELLAQGIRMGKERVRVLMQRHGIKARTKRKCVVMTDSKHHLPVAPNQLWSGDITYIPADEGWLYLAAVLETCTAAKWWAGACSRTCKPAWSRMPC